MKLKLTIPILILGLIFISGCTTQGGTTEGEGTLVMQITDKPADFIIESAIVTISDIEVHKAEYASEANQNEGNDTNGSKEQNQGSEAGWYTVVEEAQTFDLIEIKDIKELLGSTDLDSGKYTQIRLIVEQAIITINNSSGKREIHNLKIPSNKVKLITPFWIYEDEATVLTLDFDVYKSVHKAGKDKYIMKPTIKVIEG